MPVGPGKPAVGGAYAGKVGKGSRGFFSLVTSGTHAGVAPPDPPAALDPDGSPTAWCRMGQRDGLVAPALVAATAAKDATPDHLL
jgi:hypothetical protein